MTPQNDTKTDINDREACALKHLMKAKYHAKKAEKLFDDDSRGESVANNTKRWANQSINVAENYLDSEDTNSEEESAE